MNIVEAEQRPNNGPRSRTLGDTHFDRTMADFEATTRRERPPHLTDGHFLRYGSLRGSLRSRFIGLPRPMGMRDFNPNRLRTSEQIEEDQRIDSLHAMTRRLGMAVVIVMAGVAAWGLGEVTGTFDQIRNMIQQRQEAADRAQGVSIIFDPARNQQFLDMNRQIINDLSANQPTVIGSMATPAPRATSTGIRFPSSGDGTLPQ